MENLIKKINSGETLTFDEAKEHFQYMVSGDLTEAQIASTLISMKYRGETIDELSALVTVLNSCKNKFNGTADKTVDTCGTGGDGKSTVNVSTAVSIILASLEYNVVKHGNSAQSGKVGSADILKDLEVRWIGPGELSKEKIDRYNFFNINSLRDIEEFIEIQDKGVIDNGSHSINSRAAQKWKDFFFRGTGKGADQEEI